METLRLWECALKTHQKLVTAKIIIDERLEGRLTNNIHLYITFNIRLLFVSYYRNNISLMRFLK